MMRPFDFGSLRQHRDTLVIVAGSALLAAGAVLLSPHPSYGAPVGAAAAPGPATPDGALDRDAAALDAGGRMLEALDRRIEALGREARSAAYGQRSGIESRQADLQVLHERLADRLAELRSTAAGVPAGSRDDFADAYDRSLDALRAAADERAS